MKKRRPGRHLAIALRESLPRWLDFVLWLGLISAFLTPIVLFLNDLRKDPGPQEIGCFTFVFGILGVVLLVVVGRNIVLGFLAGYTIVEISHEPVPLGGTIDYVVVQARAHPWIRTMEAKLVHTVPKGRHERIAASIPLAPAEIDPKSGRRRIRGTLTLPGGPGMRPTRDAGQWEICVRVIFGRKLVLEEDYPFVVGDPAAEDNKKPPAGS